MSRAKPDPVLVAAFGGLNKRERVKPPKGYRIVRRGKVRKGDLFKCICNLGTPRGWHRALETEWGNALPFKDEVLVRKVPRAR